MTTFRNDYSEGCHPAILEALARTNFEQSEGYTEDAHCENVRKLIRTAVANALEEAGAKEDAVQEARELQVEFVPGGTMANLLTITAALRPYECVIAAPEGHINVHETGAIEANGHKVLTTADADGLLSVAGVDEVMRFHCYGQNCHMVNPRLLYFSFATETGMVHSAKQLYELRAYANKHNLLIHIDGARLACGLACDGTDATLCDIFECADAFTFGGTKNGALYGEAVVIRNKAIGAGFRAIMKQNGAIMAKGRLYGVQFETLFGTTGAQAGIAEAQGKEPMYFSLARHAVAMALQLRTVLERNGFTEFASESRTNQQFVRVSNNIAQQLEEQFGCEAFGWPDAERTDMRFVTSWATEPAHIEQLDAELRRIRQ